MNGTNWPQRGQTDTNRSKPVQSEPNRPRDINVVDKLCLQVCHGPLRVREGRVEVFEMSRAPSGKDRDVRAEVGTYGSCGMDIQASHTLTLSIIYRIKPQSYFQVPFLAILIR